MANDTPNGRAAQSPKVVSIEDARRLNDESAKSTKDKSKPGAIQLIPFEEVKLGKKRRYLIRDLIPRRDIIVLWGDPKCGKTFLALDAAMSIALGQTYRDRRVEQGTVVYCAFEGQYGFDARIEAYRRYHLKGHEGPVPFYLVGVRLDLVKRHKDLIGAITEQAPQKPVLVVLDTLNRSLPGSESNDADMTAYTLAADAISDAFDCAVLIVHHCGIAGDRPRGHTSLTGTCGAQIRVSKMGRDAVVMTVECMKDGPEGGTIHSRLEVVEVGIDEDGSTITSCVVVPAHGSTEMSASARMSNATYKALDILRRTIDDVGTQWYTGEKVTTIKEWKERCITGGLAKGTETSTHNKAFNRAREHLTDANLIAIEGPNVWIPGAAAARDTRDGQDTP